MLNGISLFTGYAGIDLALRDHVRPLIYCDIEKYPHGILLSRMDDGSIPFAPIWDDITTMDGTKFKGLVDIVYGGFPCQDISAAGKGAGLEGKRSGLFFEVIRICKEASPLFIFLENVPAIRTRGSIEVAEALASIGYDCRWGVISASEVGANHKRERWFCLATHSDSVKLWDESRRSFWQDWESQILPRNNGEKKFMANSSGYGDTRELRDLFKQDAEKSESKEQHQNKAQFALHDSWWATEPNVGRVANGVAFRMDRIKALGNGVVPLQVQTAFKKLIGIG